MARVHARRFADHGHVVGGDAEGLELDAGSWTDVLVDRIEAWRDLATSDRFDHHFDEVITAVEANRELLSDAPAALLHGDPAHPNCYLVDDDVGFLDWELAYVGDPVRELRRAHRIQFEPMRDPVRDEVITAFYDGYRERAGGLPDGFDARTPVYDAVAFLGTSGYVDKYAEFLDESQAELADWMQEEMKRRLART
jgi:aminoglycoside phosphotransferase (APT) family kinase protein